MDEMNKLDKIDSLNRLMEIRDQMGELISEADDLVRREFPYDYPNASSYWLAHIKCSLGGYGYHTYSTTFLSALESYEEECYDDEREEEEPE